MTLVDNRGRLFGRLNVVDAALLIFVVALVPLGYGAYLLFKTPAPTLVQVEPPVVEQADRIRVTLVGTNLRPYMRVSFNAHQARNFLFSDIDRAEVDVDMLPAGEYEIVLYDQTQERFRLPKGLVVRPSPLPATHVRVVGSFANLDAARAKTITAGTRIPGFAEILEVGRPMPEATRVYSALRLLEIPTASAVRLPATLLLPCFVRVQKGRPDCAIGDAPLQPAAFITAPFPAGALPFQIDQVMGSQPLQAVEVRARFGADPLSLSRISVGDVDQGDWVNELAAGAVVISADPVLRRGDGSATRDVRLRVRAQRDSSSWQYAGGALRIGSSLVLSTPLYRFEGTVIDLLPPPAAP